MSEESKIILLLRREEGVCSTPYIDSLGYPTVGVGFRLGPQGSSLSQYNFTLSNNTIDVWLNDNVADLQVRIMQSAPISSAFSYCNQPRRDILLSMAYQLGITGLSRFHKMLSAISQNDWNESAAQMSDSTWAKQTRERARRHAAVMMSGKWKPVYDF